jgi:hypothetical protein
MLSSNKLDNSMEKTIIKIPNILGGDVRNGDNLFALIRYIPENKFYIFDLSEVSFVKPFGVMTLALLLRVMAAKTRDQVILTNIQEDVYKYLERIDFFTLGSQWFIVESQTGEVWSRKKVAENLLELTGIATYEERVKILTRCKNIFSYWMNQDKVSFILKIVSELCDNVAEHSGDPNVAILVQKYAYHGSAKVIIAIGDIGKGIRRSLSQVFPEIGSAPIDFILAALSGRTSRLTGRGGLGLDGVEKIVEENSGSLWLRSENAAIQSFGQACREMNTSLPYFPGTQVVIELNFR